MHVPRPPLQLTRGTQETALHRPFPGSGPLVPPSIGLSRCGGPSPWSLPHDTLQVPWLLLPWETRS